MSDDLVSSEIKQLADRLYLRKLITIDGWALVRHAEREIAGRDAVQPGRDRRREYAQAILDELLGEGEGTIYTSAIECGSPHVDAADIAFVLLTAPADVRVRALLKVLDH